MIDDRRIFFLYIDWGFGTQVVCLAFAFSIVSFYFLLATFVWAGYLVLFGSKKFCNSGFLILGLSLNFFSFLGGGGDLLLHVSFALAWTRGPGSLILTRRILSAYLSPGRWDWKRSNICPYIPFVSIFLLSYFTVYICGHRLSIVFWGVKWGLGVFTDLLFCGSGVRLLSSALAYYFYLLFFFCQVRCLEKCCLSFLLNK